MTILPSGDFRGWMMMFGENVGEVSENLGCLQMPLFATKPAHGRA